MGIALVVTLHPVTVIVTGAGKADHAPRAHIAIAAVDRVSEKSLLRVFQEQREERLTVDAVQFGGAVLDVADDCVCVRIAQRSEGFAFLGLAILVERRQRLAESHCWTVFVLRALLLRSLDERRAHIETGLAPVRAGELPIDVDRASGVLAAGRVGIGRDEAIDQRFHRRGLAGVEEEPRSFDERRRRSRLRPPWQRLRAGMPCSRHEQERRAPQQLAPVKLHRRPSPEDTSP
jgi:hypothetical protein